MSIFSSAHSQAVRGELAHAPPGRRSASPPGRPEHRVEALDLPALQAMRAEWLALWRRTGASPFQAPGAVLAWTETHAPDLTQAIAVRDRGRLVALAPVVRQAGRLVLAGTGPTDYGDVLIEPGRFEVADLLLRELAHLAENQGVHALELRQLRHASLLLRAGVPDGWRQTQSSDEICPVAPVLGRSGLDGVAPHRRRELDAARLRAERDGPPSRFVTADGRSLARYGEALFELHAAEWRAQGEAGLLAEPAMAAFVLRLLPELQADGALRLHALQLGDRTAAVLIALHDRRSAYLYLSGEDPALEAWSPGDRLLAHAFRAAADEGLHEMHLLGGREACKYDWGAGDRPVWRRDLSRVQA